MAGGVMTLKERLSRERERMQQAVIEIDALLIGYARQHGGRFIRYGSTAKGRMMLHSDVDIVADFDGEAAGPAASYAEGVCRRRGMAADVRAVHHTSAALLGRALAEGIILS